MNGAIKGFAILVVVLAVAYVAVPRQSSETADPVISVDASDKLMNAAIDKAIATLDVFWEKRSSANSDETSFAIKLAVTDGKETEHFWCGSIEGEKTSATCTIDNEPAAVKNVTAGQRVTIADYRISDWMYQKDGKIVGGQTIRALIPTLPPVQAEQYKALLAQE